MKLGSKDYYWLFLINGSLSTLVQRIGTATLLWQLCQKTKLIFNRVKVTCKENHVREFYYQLIHCIVTTKKEITLYGMTDNKEWFFCGEPDSVLHTFQNCSTMNSFHNRVLNWVNEKHDISILFCRKLNYCFILTKEMKNSNLFLLSTHYCKNFKTSFVYDLVSWSSVCDQLTRS